MSSIHEHVLYVPRGEVQEAACLGDGQNRGEMLLAVFEISELIARAYQRSWLAALSTGLRIKHKTFSEG